MKTSGQMSRADVITVMVCLLIFAMTGYAMDHLQREYENRLICSSNLRGLGTAQMVYANDYDDAYAKAGGGGNNRWAKNTPGWYDPDKDWSGDDDVTVGASLYLLVREADVSPRSFVCPSSSREWFDGSNPDALDYTELWDFGSEDYLNTGPKNCVSYSYHHPFGRFAADGTRSAAFAVMSDRSPWYDSKIRKGPASDGDWKKRVGYIVWNDALRGDRDWQLRVGNSPTHLREVQGVLFADGHVEFTERSDVGVRHDNMFTPQGPWASTEDYIRIGQMPDPYGIGYGEPHGSSDSFLVNDDEINPCFADQPGDVNGDCNVDFGDLAILSRYWMESTRVED